MNKHSPSVDLRGADPVALYRGMLRIRLVEEEIATRYPRAEDALPGASVDRAGGDRGRRLRGAAAGRSGRSPPTAVTPITSPRAAISSPCCPK